MKDARVLMVLGVMLPLVFSAAPVLAGDFGYGSGASQTGGMSTAWSDESPMLAAGQEEESDYEMLDGIAPQARYAGGQEQAEVESIAGRVHDFLTTRVPDDPNPHVIAKIDTPRGVATVDLGSVDQLPMLEPGQFVRLRGFWGQVNNRNVFVTTRLNDGQRTVRIFVGPQRQRMTRIHGEVLGTYTLSSDQTGNQLRFARIRLDSGRTRAVNLGPAAKTAHLDLQRGDEITAVGRPIGGWRFRAHEITANGESVAIDWGAAVRTWAGQRFQQAGFPEGR